MLRMRFATAPIATQRNDRADQYNEQMQIEFTQHALTRMVERGISRDEVLATLGHPLRTVNAQNNRFESDSMKIEYDPKADAM
jgi:outer membrane protein assembly factor BamE (lipoprotein component of BamABCDE complex)